MLRFVLLAAALLLLVLLVRGALRRRRDDETPPPREPGRREVGVEAMVACDHCGVHLPRTDAVVAPSGTFCGEAHRRRHEQGEPPPR